MSAADSRPFTIAERLAEAVGPLALIATAPAAFTIYCCREPMGTSPWRWGAPGAFHPTRHGR